MQFIASFIGNWKLYDLNVVFNKMASIRHAVEI